MATTFTIGDVKEDKGETRLDATTDTGDLVSLVIVAGKITTSSLKKNAVAQDESPMDKPESVFQAVSKMAETMTTDAIKQAAGKSVTYDPTKPQPVEISDAVPVDEPVGEVIP